MTPAPIVQTGNPVLRARAMDVPPDRITTPEFQQLIATMIATMRAAPGVGLAAPQIGIPWRVIVCEDSMQNEALSRLPFPTRVFINPELTVIGTETETFFEGCLSVAGFSAIVERAKEVEVKGLDETGAPVTWRVRGWAARILQHECDHIDGTLYIDRMKTRSFTTTELAREFYGGRSIAEVHALLKLT